MKKQFLLFFLLICCCLTYKTAYGEEKQNRIVRREYWIFIIENESGLLGYYDTKSGYYKEPEYDSISDNSDYDAPLLVKKDGLWGYISRTTGEVVIPLQFTADSAYSDFQNGYAVIGYRLKTNDESIRYHYILIDTNGNQVIIPDEYSIVSGVCGSKKSVIVRGFSNNRYGFGIYQIDKGLVVEPIYDSIWFGDCNYFCYEDASGMVGMMNADGDVVLKPEYSTNDAPIQYLSNKKGTASLLIDGYYEVFNRQGDQLYIFIDNSHDCFNVFDMDKAMSI